MSVSLAPSVRAELPDERLIIRSQPIRHGTKLRLLKYGPFHFPKWLCVRTATDAIIEAITYGYGAQRVHDKH